MIFLYILLSIVAVIILLLCIRVTAVLNYNINLTFDVKWLFLKFRIYPKKEKQEKKKEKAEEDKPKEEKKKKNKKGPGPLKAFYENQGFGGVLELIKNTSDAVSGLLKRVFKSLVINEIYLGMRISGDDAASTAIDYGETCAKVFPAMGAICSTMKVRKYDVDIRPDFISSVKKAQFHVVISAIPIKITNAAVILAVQLLFKVLLKLFIGSRKIKEKH